MSHRFRLCLITCAACLPVAPSLTASALALAEHPALSRPQTFLIAEWSPDASRRQDESPRSEPSPQRDMVGWIATTMVLASVVGGVFYNLGRRQVLKNQVGSDGVDRPSLLSHSPTPQVTVESAPHEASYQTSYQASPQASNPPAPHPDTAPATDGTDPESPESAFPRPARMARVDIVEELIGDLHNPDISKRRKAIWELGQCGDSRAIQVMIDLMTDADSSQRSLILASASEIGVRTLRPINRGLLLSLQDDSSDVRKNAIRDVTRIYDVVAQVSQLLQHATCDPDEEVQETARWALTQLNRIRSLPALIDAEGTISLPSRTHMPDRLSDAS